MSLFLARGQRSNDVVALQNALNVSQPAADPLELDGIFGPATEAAVRRWQRQGALKLDGIAGPQTLGTLFEGVVVENRLAIRVADAGRGMDGDASGGVRARRGPRSPWAVPPPGLPADPPVAPDVSLGVAGLQLRSGVVRDWLSAGFPKPELVVPRLPPPELTLRASATTVPGLVDAGRVPDRLLTRERVTGLAFKAEAAGGVTADEKAEFAIKYCVVQPKAKPYLFGCMGSKRVDDLAEPDVARRTKAGLYWQVGVYPFTIAKGDWNRLSWKFGSVLAASYFSPALMGGPKYDKLGFAAALQAELGFRVYRPWMLDLVLQPQLGVEGSVTIYNGEISARLLPLFTPTFSVRVQLPYRRR